MMGPGLVIRVALFALVALPIFAFGGRANALTCAELGLAEVPESTDTAESRRWAKRIGASILAAQRRVVAVPDPPIAFVERPEASAWYCADADTIYISLAFLRFAWLGRDGDGADLLAWAIAHELAHRRFDPRNDATFRGATPAAPVRAATRSCPLVDSELEAAADHRAAFLMALATNPDSGRGFSPFELSRRDTVVGFFVAELGWDPDCEALIQRVAAMQSALARMHELAALYRAATLLTFAVDLSSDTIALGPPELLAEVQRVLSSGSHVSSPWEALPELDLLRAFAHLDRAGQTGWCPPDVARHGLTPDPCTLPCPPVFPRHPALSPWDRRGRRVARPMNRDDDLVAARNAIERARSRGLSSAHLAGAETCLAYQQRDPDAASAALQRLRPETARVRAEQRNLFTLLALQRFVLAEPSAVGSTSWLAALHNLTTTRHSALMNDSPTASTIARWLDPEAPRVVAPRAAFAAFFPMGECSPVTPTQAIKLGQHDSMTLRGPGCLTIAGVRIERLNPASVPARRDLWAEACDLAEVGVADDGQSVVRATCPSFLGDTFIIFFDGFNTREAARLRPGDVGSP